MEGLDLTMHLLPSQASHLGAGRRSSIYCLMLSSLLAAQSNRSCV